MNAHHGFTAPESGSAEIPTFETLAADPEIAVLLDFEPVPRKMHVEGGWTPDAQREFIARLAMCGSPGRACEEMDRHRTGVTKLYKSQHGASFRAAWDGAVELARARRAQSARAQPVSPGIVPPSVDHRFRPQLDWNGAARLPGQVMNELSEWEDEASFRQRAEDAKESIRNKLVRARRLYLEKISGNAGKRAAFEILTELPVDWEKAARLEPQEFEPLVKTNQRQPDMILTAEDGWSFGEFGYGPDRMAQLRQDIDEWRAEEGLPPVDWSEGEEEEERETR